MSRIAVLVLACAMLIPAAARAACGGAQLCDDPTGICTFAAATCTVDLPPEAPPGNTTRVAHLEDRDVIISKTLVITPGTDTFINAHSFTLAPGAKIIVGGTVGTIPNNGGSLTINVTGDIDLQSTNAAFSLISTAGKVTGGALTLIAGGNIGANARLVLVEDNNNSGADGGDLTLTAPGIITVGTIDPGKKNTNTAIIAHGGDVSGGGAVSLIGDTAVTLASKLDVSGRTTNASGGAVEISSLNGPIALKALIDAHGGDAGGGGSVDVGAGQSVSVEASITADKGDGGVSIDISSDTGDITVAAAAVISTSASDAADAGPITLSAGGAITIAGDIQAQGAGGGFGGDIEADSGGGISVTSTGTILAPGALGGGGGSITLNAGGDVVLDGLLDANVSGTDTIGGSITVTGFTITASDIIDAGGDLAGGDAVTGVWLAADSTLTLLGTAKLHNDGTTFAGFIELDGCTVETKPGALVSAAGPSGSILVRGGHAINLSGLFKTGTNASGASGTFAVQRRSTATYTPSGLVVVAATSTATVNDVDIACCGADCPTTTTTSTTTTTLVDTTTTTVDTTTTSTAPSTTSSTVASTTSTTAASTTTVASTSSTTAASTSTTSTAPSTSSTSTTALSSTSTTSTQSTTSTTEAASTTTSSSTSSTSTPVTTSTVPPPPTSCLDQPLDGFDAVSCRVDTVNDTVTSTSDADLGGAKWAKRLRSAAGKARSAVDAVRASRKASAFRHALVQLKTFENGVRKASRHGMPADVRDTLTTLANSASATLRGLKTPK